jgi:hypothetical protein
MGILRLEGTTEFPLLWGRLLRAMKVAKGNFLMVGLNRVGFCGDGRAHGSSSLVLTMKENGIRSSDAR